MTIEQAMGIAIQHHREGRLAEAEEQYKQILAQQPNHDGALHFLGVAAAQRGRPEAAVELIRRAIGLNPGQAIYHNNLANSLIVLERLDEAIESYRRAIELRPTYIEAQNNMGNALRILGRNEEAIAALQKVIGINPRLPDAHNNLGAALVAQGRLKEAISAFKQAVELKPDWPTALSNLGNALRDDGRLQEALAVHSKAVALSPDTAELHNNLGNVHSDMQHIEEALGEYRRAIQLKPDYYEGYNNLGTNLQSLGQIDAAIDAYRTCVQIKGEFANAHFNLANLLLLKGDFAAGWEEYEWRWKVKSFFVARDFTQPQWRGERLDGRTILISAEQGMGDTMQFVRYVPMVAERGGRIILECHRDLKGLLGEMPGVRRVIGRGEALADFDVYCPLLSLPRIFQTRLESIPAAVPYIRANGAKTVQGQGPHIGLVWAGTRIHPNDRNRSVALSRLMPLLEFPATFHSLQIGSAAKQIEELGATNLIDHCGELADWRDTAALAAGLDLIITVDTAVAHLAGAMGKAVWVLLPFVPDWRWMLEREDSPWYPTMRLFRQRAIGDWDGVVEEVAGALQERYR